MIQMINKLKKNQKGFTLVELIVVLVILAILAAFTIPAMLGFVNDAKGKAYVAQAREVKLAYQSAATEIGTSASGGVAAVAGKYTVAGAAGGTETSTQKAVQKQAKKVLIPDIFASETATATVDGAIYQVLINENAQVTELRYSKDGFEIVIDETNGTQVEKPSNTPVYPTNDVPAP